MTNKQEVKMPDLATTGSPMRILVWRVKPGEVVTQGQIILEVETDKAVTEVESTASGRVAEIIVAAGQEVDAGTVIALVESSDTVPQSAAPPAPAPVAAPAVAKPTPPPAKAAGGMFARNRAAAATRGASPASPSASAQSAALSPARRMTAQRLQSSKQTIPHFYLQTSFNATAITAARNAAQPERPAWDAFFVKAVSQVLPGFEQLACRYEQDRLVPQGTDTIGVAADLDGDLYVVPVEKPGASSIADISRQIRERVAAIRRADPGAKVIRPGVMTISNLGACNVETFIAIVNPPESAILAIGKVRPVVVAANDGTFAVQPRANLTLSVDHRVVSGKYAADFLGALVEELEKPS
jgi:pyruvate dehydrogenase E2 component (dihydrolipoamide acetyltransferase)